MRKHTIHIHGDPWVYAVGTVLDINKRCGYDTQGNFLGLTCPNTHELIFLPEGVRRDTIVHELFHVYFRYLHLDSAQLGHLQVEEIIAEMIGDNLDRISRQARQIEHTLRRDIGGTLRRRA